MGNRVTSRTKTSSDGSKKTDAKRRQKKQRGSSSSAANSSTSREKKVISCPDLSGAVPYKFEDDQRPVDVKIYRSYSNVADSPDKRLAASDPAPDFKVYRRSIGNLALGNTDEKSQTLPKGFGRSRSAVSSLQHQRHRSGGDDGLEQHGNGTLQRDRRSEGGGGVVRRRSTLGSGCNLGATKGSRRTLSTASMNSIGYKVNPEDFPDTATIKRRLTLFETSFVRSLVEVFSSDLPGDTLLSLLSIAIRPDRANQQVSLSQYLKSEIPADLNEPDDRGRLEYVLTIPQMLFKELFRIRREHINDVGAWTALGRHILSCQAMEAANELSRVFEYQLSLIPEGLPMELLCRHGAQCVREYLRKTNGHIDRNSIVQGVVRGSLRTPEVCPKFSIILGERELKWNLFEIFKKPGLRKELFLLSTNDELDVEQAPWRFFSSAQTDPMLFGYRGLIVDWDFASFSYQLNGEDEASYPDEMDWRPDDFHRDYNPYRRLVGQDLMLDFCSASKTDQAKGQQSLGDYVRGVQGRSYSRDRIQPVYRPLGVSADELRDRVPLESLNLGNADTLRLRRAKKREGVDRSPRERGPESVTVVMTAVPRGDGRVRQGPSRSTETSPNSGVASLSPAASTNSQDSRRSDKMRYKNSSLSETGSPTSAGSRLSASRRDDSAVSKQTEENNAPISPKIQVAVVKDVTPVVSADATANGPVVVVDDDDEEGDFVQTALKPSQVVSSANRRSTTVTSDV